MPTPPPNKLHFEYLPSHTVGQKKSIVRRIEKEQHSFLVSALLQKRKDQHPEFKFIGEEFVLSTSTINSVASQGRYQKSPEDIGGQFAVQSDLRKRFYNVMIASLSPAKRPCMHAPILSGILMDNNY